MNTTLHKSPMHPHPGREETLDTRGLTRRAALACALMGATAVATRAFQPTPSEILPGSGARLADMVPAAFGRWQEDRSTAQAIVNPSLQEALDSLYADQLSRVYLHAQTNQRIMLSLAYGKSQKRDLQIHKPEVCYVAQGFKMSRVELTDLQMPFGMIPAMRLVAQQGNRQEPITYWIRSGDLIVRGWMEQNLARVRNGMKGIIPDGLLVRVSSISSDVPAAFAAQQEFLVDMLEAIPRDFRPMFLGRLVTTGS